MVENLLNLPGHAVIGAHLIDHWGLPAELVDGVGYHHSMAMAEAPDISAVLVIADYICLMKQAGAPDNFSEAKLDHDAWQRLAIPANALSQILAGIDEHINQVREMFVF
jgi:HD-like signal output (HDOD) protein